MDNYKLFEAYLTKVGITVQKELLLRLFLSTDFKHKNKIDFYLELGENKCFVEIEGGAFTGGRHTNGVGFINDMLKYNAMASTGIPLYRFTPDMVNSHPVVVSEFLLGVLSNDITHAEISDFVEYFKIKRKKKTNAQSIYKKRGRK